MRMKNHLAVLAFSQNQSDFDPIWPYDGNTFIYPNKQIFRSGKVEFPLLISYFPN